MKHDTYEIAQGLTRSIQKAGYQLIAIHEYTDENGKNSYYRLRFKDPESGDKKIYPMSFIDGKWQLKEPLFNGKKPLYQLHLLKQQDSIYWVEGEQKAEMLSSLGLMATTAGGVSSIKNANLEPLRGKRIVIWPDNDDAGFKHANDLVQMLNQIGCSVSLVDVQQLNLPHKGDVVDWIEMNPGTTRESVERLPLKTLPKTQKHVMSSKRGFQMKKDPKINHLETAKDIIQQLNIENVIQTQGILWNWDEGGVWRKMDDREIKQIIHQFTANKKITASLVNSILDLVKTEVHINKHQFDINTNDINCLNGELSLLNDKWILKPHNKLNYRTSIIPVAYDPAATAPRFKQFLNEIFNNDPDKDEKIHTVLEAMGYSLIPSCHLEKFIVLIGSGANGKSVLLYILTELLGRDNVSAVQPEQFDQRFQRGHLRGKLANIITEIKEGGEIADAQLKSLVSGEMTTAEHKHKDPFEFIPHATHWFGTNHLPHTRDFSEAFFRRAILLTFNNIFSGSNRDVNLSKTLVSELPGILNLALDGLKRLLGSNAFTSCNSSDELLKEWRVEVDQVAQFIQEECDLDPQYTILSSSIYNTYKGWAENAGIKRTLNRNNFTSRLIRRGCKKDRGTGGSRVIRGIRLKLEAHDTDYHRATRGC